MSPIGTINPLSVAAPQLQRIDAPLPKTAFAPGGPLTAAPAQGFGSMIDGLISTVDAKQDAAREISQKVLLGQSNELHQSVIAMQESSVAFSLLVEVRNKLVESYQELMRMQV